MGADPYFEAARAVAPYSDDGRVLELTREALSHGHSVLQIFKAGTDDRGHVAALLDLAAFPEGATVLDAGCGVGAVAALMEELRPDLTFWLLNVSLAQLGLCPERFRKLHACFEDVPLDDASVDAVMFCYSLGHGRLGATLAEAARVLRPGGVVFVYDLAADDPRRVVSVLGYVPHAMEQVQDAAKAAGLRVDLARVVPDTSAEGALAYIDRDTFAWLFDGVSPVAYRMVKHA